MAEKITSGYPTRRAGPESLLKVPIHENSAVNASGRVPSYPAHRVRGQRWRQLVAAFKTPQTLFSYSRRITLA